MDPESVVEGARGEIDGALLTRTGGGFLGRKVLADRPLIEHLRDGETLHYLLAGAAAPTWVEDGRATDVPTTGSYRTLLAVTDGRLLVVAGSRDGDEVIEFGYGPPLEVDLRRGLLTDTVVVAPGPARQLEVTVGSGSDPSAAVGYARERASAAEAEVPATSELVEAVFGTLVGEEPSGPAVEPSADLDAGLEDLRAHRGRLADHLAAGDRDAALAAAATVENLGATLEELAEGRGRPAVRRRVAAIRAEARRSVVAAEFGLDDPEALAGSLGAVLLDLLRSLDAYAFEELVADVWAQLGYRTAVTQSSNDEGIDVVAERSSPVEQRMLIQAKRYGPDTKVGREEVQQYASLHRQDPGADLVVVVTTGEFTGPARKAAGDLNVKLVDGDRLVELIEENDLYGVVARHVGGDDG